MIFEKASGLNINYSKSEIFGIRIYVDDMDCMTNTFRCKQDVWPSTYLGLPLGGNPNSSLFWQPICEKYNINFIVGNMPLSQKVVDTLNQATLTHLPVYCPSLFKLPCNVTKCLEKLFKDFFRRVLMGRVVYII